MNKTVWGYSLSQNLPILVPESIAYYSLGHRDAYVYETSNGCAIGGSLEEAIFHGILEIVERDAFCSLGMLNYLFLAFDLSSAHDTELQLMIQRLYTITGYELHAFNATMEHGIPSLWVIAKIRVKWNECRLCWRLSFGPSPCFKEYHSRNSRHVTYNR